MTIEINFTVNDNNVDDHVDLKIQECIHEKKSFFMFAGAGSGKTRSLEQALKFISEEYAEALLIRHKQVAVITYTNVARDEILRRVAYNPLFAVSTIHSFLWELIKPYQKDIQEWKKKDLEKKLDDLEEKQSNPKRRRDFSEEIKKTRQRINSISSTTKWTYNPNGENVGRGSLNHSEVISMGAEFIENYHTMQRVMKSKFPILFIDESQDTSKKVMDSFLKAVSEDNHDFLIGMFGDTMQRIYLDGKEELSNCIPEEWEKPEKKMNHRSTDRIVNLANSIRGTIDNQKQKARTDKPNGIVRLFILPNNVKKDEVELCVFSKMSEITKDEKWNVCTERKVLVLEHKMAARRAGFVKLCEALGKNQNFNNGSISELSFLMNVVFPIVEASREKNEFALMKMMKKYSPLLKGPTFKVSSNQRKVLEGVNKKLEILTELWSRKTEPTGLEIYRALYNNALLELPQSIEEVLSSSEECSESIAELRQGLSVGISEIVSYWSYINEKTSFATHQGIKGLEFDRVAVIMDDESAGGNLFSYEKLFGAKELSQTDEDNEKKGKDNAITRTTRLLYVCCTRAQESLALIAYTNNTNAVKETVMNNNWFSEDEIVIVGDSDF